ncbi:MAG: phage tail protein [Gemmataceae bacterium]|nr:phage tail protein [Gemmataceae bacterium]
MPPQRAYLTSKRPTRPSVRSPESWEKIKASDLGGGGGNQVRRDPVTEQMTWVTVPEATGTSEGGAATVGDMKPNAGNLVPVGWLPANGSWVSKTTYPELWARLDDGTRYGTPSGDLFPLPNVPQLVSGVNWYIWPGAGTAVRQTYDSTVFTFDSTADTEDGD